MSVWSTVKVKLVWSTVKVKLLLVPWHDDHRVFRWANAALSAAWERDEVFKVQKMRVVEKVCAVLRGEGNRAPGD